MIVIPQLASVLLYSPENTVIGWVLLTVGIFIGFWLVKPNCCATYVSQAISLHLISRDLKIHNDIVLIAGIPITLLDWPNHAMIQFWFIFVIFNSHFLSEPLDTINHSWFAAVSAAYYLSFLPNFRTKLLGTGLILIRHLYPHKIYFFYGCLLFTSQEHMHMDMSFMLDQILKIIFFFILSSEVWFEYVFLAIIIFQFIYK